MEKGNKIKVGIIIVSDTRYSGLNKEETIPLLTEFIKKEGWILVDASIVPDEINHIKENLLYYSDVLKVDLILTSGGTGPSKSDVTPEATREIINKELPGFSEAIRIVNFKNVKTSILSRGITGIRGNTLIINLPGNPQGAIDSLLVVKDAIPHCLEIMQGEVEIHGKHSK